MDGRRMRERKSIFLQYMGSTPQMRVIDFLMENHFFDFPITEIARKSRVSYNTLKKFFPKFLRYGIVIKTRKIGKSIYYKLNLSHPFVKSLMKLDWELSKAEALRGQHLVVKVRKK